MGDSRVMVIILVYAVIHSMLAHITMASKQLLVIFLTLVFINTSTSPKIDPLRDSITEEDQRAFIKCHVLLGDSVTDIYTMLQKIARRKALTQRTVYNLFNQYQAGTRTKTSRGSGPGAPRTQATEAKLNDLTHYLSEHDDSTEDEMATHLGVSKATVSRMINEIGAKKVCTRWVPHELNIGNKQTRIDSCQENLNMYRTSKDMLDRIIAIDESWLRSYDPQDSQSAKRWCLPSQEP